MKKNLYISTPGNNINNINSEELLIKLLFHHLEDLDFLRERHANRLNSWVGCKSVLRMKESSPLKNGYLQSMGLYRAFHNVLRDYKKKLLLQNRRTRLIFIINQLDAQNPVL